MVFKVEWMDQLPSTNTFLKERFRLEPELASGTIIAAREQTMGRGRRDRTWVGGMNENLTFSILFKYSSLMWSIPSVTMAVAIGVTEFLQCKSVNSLLKWPNDVLVDGKKICGILSEGVSGAIVIGVGLNVNMGSAQHIDQPATSMQIETGQPHCIDDVLEELLVHISTWIERWERGGFPAVRSAWESYVPTMGKEVTVRDGDHTRKGILRGFGDNGELLLESNGALDSVWAGDVSS